MSLNRAYATSKMGPALTLSSTAGVDKTIIVRLVPGTFAPTSFVVQVSTEGVVRLRQVALPGYADLESELLSNGTTAYWGASSADMYPVPTGLSRRVDVEVATENFLAIYLTDETTIRIAAASRVTSAPVILLSRTLT